MILSIAATIGKPIIVGIDACIHDGFVLFSELDRARISPDFLYYFLQHKEAELSGRGQPGTQKNINTSIVDSIALKLPPLSEQRKIAAILSSLDNAIEATQAVIDQLQIVKKAMMAELLTRGLPGRHTRFKQTEIGEVPEEWDVVQLESLADQERSSFVNGPFGSDLLKSDLRTSGVHVIYIRDIREGRYLRKSDAFVDNSKARELAFCDVRPGDLLIAKVGDPPGVAALYPEGQPSAIVTQDVIRLRVNAARVRASLLRFAMNSDRGKAAIEGIAIKGTRQRVALGEYKKLKFAIPPLWLQAEISSSLQAVEEREAAETAALETFRRLKSALMSVLLTGELRVIPDEAA